MRLLCHIHQLATPYGIGQRRRIDEPAQIFLFLRGTVIRLSLSQSLRLPFPSCRFLSLPDWFGLFLIPWLGRFQRWRSVWPDSFDDAPGIYVNMKVLHDLHTTIMTLTNEERRRFKVKNGDTEGIVNIPLQMLGMKLSVFINEDTEHPGIMKLSLRSVGDFPCDQMASRFFNGGGHKNASGGKLQCTMAEAIEKVKMAIGLYADMLK